MTQRSPSSSELAHYGVKGMKWGVRRAEAKQARTAKRIERGGELVRQAKAAGKKTDNLAARTSAKGTLKVAGILLGGGIAANKIPNDIARNGAHIAKLFMAGRQGAITYGEVVSINAYNRSLNGGGR